jgi:TusA-related sulfurtransferase
MIMKHKGQKMYFLHPGDLRRYRTEKDFTWEKIRKIGYYPEEIAESIEQENQLRAKKKGTEVDEGTVLEIDMTEEELRKMIREYLTDDRLFEEVQKAANRGKPQRIVINLPGWLKERLKQKSLETGTSMNAVMRLALTEYLAKGE